MSGAGTLLVLGGAEIAQRRMPLLTVVPDFDVREDRPARRRTCRKRTIRTLGFQGAPEAFLHGVVVAAPHRAHADVHLSPLQ